MKHSRFNKIINTVDEDDRFTMVSSMLRELHAENSRLKKEAEDNKGPKLWNIIKEKLQQQANADDITIISLVFIPLLLIFLTCTGIGLLFIVLSGPPEYYYIDIGKKIEDKECHHVMLSIPWDKDPQTTGCIDSYDKAIEIRDKSNRELFSRNK